MQKAFPKDAMQGIYAKIEAARAASPAQTAEPKAPADPRAEKKRDVADLFTRRCASLRKALPWIRQPQGETFKSFVCQMDQQTRVVQICERFASRLLDRVVDRKHAELGLLLAGTTGTGKTRLAESVLRVLAEAGAPGYFITSSDYFDLFTPSFSEKLDVSYAQLRELFAGVSCLVFDDVGTTSWTDARRDRLQQLIDARAAAHLPTIVTTNLTKKQMSAEGAERITSRMSQYLYPLGCVWPDWRERVAARNCNPMEVF